MDPYFFSLLYRERLAQFEREAEIARHLPKRERRGLKQFRSWLPGSQRRAPLITRTAAEARPCH